MKTLLVPVDLSRVSSRVCTVACDLALATGAALVLLHVVPRQAVVLRAYGFAAAEVRTMMRELEKREMRRLLRLARRCEGRGVSVQAVLRTGAPAPTILAKAAALRAAMIVIGSHGHTAAYDFVVGSTTQRVLRKAGVPVLVVPMRPAKS